MKIGVVSDSHDHVKLLRRALEVFRQAGVGAVLHAGDFVAPFSAKLLADPELMDQAPLYCVYGNNDGERVGLRNILPQVVDGPLRVELAGKVFVLHHFIDWIDAENLTDVDAVITGHSHQIVNETRDGVLFLNPGECCGVLTGRPTAAIVDTDTMAAEIVDLA